MSNWVLKCNNCDSVFTHSEISDVDLGDYYMPPKPEFPPRGSELECPNCGSKAIYQRFALSYQA
jgi:DNA-directed RNA polymerase subunit RPC12/RpoP